MLTGEDISGMMAFYWGKSALADIYHPVLMEFLMGDNAVIIVIASHLWGANSCLLEWNPFQKEPGVQELKKLQKLTPF